MDEASAVGRLTTVSDDPQFIADWKDRRASLLKEMTKGLERQQSKEKTQRQKDRVYSHLWFAFKVWTPRLEKMDAFLREKGLADTEVGRRFLQTSEEMRKLGRQMQEILDG
jgi:hypothetical protein